MKNIKFQLVVLVILAASVSCQVQAPAAEAPEVEAEIPVAESTDLPSKQPVTIQAENLDLLEKTAELPPLNLAMNCAWSADSRVISVSDLTWAGLYDAETQDLIAQFTGDETTALYAVSPDETLAAYSLDGKTVQVYDFSTKADRFTLTPDFAYSGVFFSADGKQLSVESLDAIEVELFETESGAQIGTLNGFETAAPVYHAVFSPDGNYLLWVARGTAQAMEIDSQNFMSSLDHEDFISAAQLSHDNNKVATAAAGTLNGEFQPLVTLWDTQNGSVLWQTGNSDNINSLSFSNGDEFLAAGTKNEVVFFDTSTGEVLSRRKTGGDAVNILAFSPDSRSLLTCSSDGIAALWKIRVE